MRQCVRARDAEGALMTSTCRACTTLTCTDVIRVVLQAAAGALSTDGNCVQFVQCMVGSAAAGALILVVQCMVGSAAAGALMAFVYSACSVCMGVRILFKQGWVSYDKAAGALMASAGRRDAAGLLLAIVAHGQCVRT